MTTNVTGGFGQPQSNTELINSIATLHHISSSELMARTEVLELLSRLDEGANIKIQNAQRILGLDEAEEANMRTAAQRKKREVVKSCVQQYRRRLTLLEQSQQRS